MCVCVSNKSLHHKSDLDIEWSRLFYQVWRQLVYETAEVYSAMVDCKADIMSELNQRPSQQAVTKLNSLCQKSIHKYLEYIGSLKTPEGTLPEPLPPGS